MHASYNVLEVYEGIIDDDGVVKSEALDVIDGIDEIDFVTLVEGVTVGTGVGIIKIVDKMDGCGVLEVLGVLEGARDVEISGVKEGDTESRWGVAVGLFVENIIIGMEMREEDEVLGVVERELSLGYTHVVFSKCWQFTKSPAIVGLSSEALYVSLEQVPISQT